MQVLETISWQPQIDWPAPTQDHAGALNYAVYKAPDMSTIVASVTDGSTSVAVTYDDSQPATFIIRPVDNVSAPTQFGPSQAVVFGYVLNRAWFRSHIRKSMSDRGDEADATITLTDDELNGFINEAIRDYSIRFPTQKDTTIPVNMTGDPKTDRNYDLPDGCYEVISVRYSRATGHMDMFLKQMPYKGGETMSTNWVGYAKFGVWQSPLGGRYFPGNYYVWEKQLWLDFDPTDPSDLIYINYKALYPLPTDDITVIPIPEEHVELVTLYAEAKAWLAVESKDVRLSRWRTREDGGSRKDMPTEVMSNRMFNAYKQKVNELRTLRTRPLRLVRRT